jgi:tRNA pseudouridine55 synthase
VIEGLAVVDKPAGMTSHDVVSRCRKLFAMKRVGHAGTLDPDATGVLLVGLGRATRLMQFMSGLGKSYTAEVVLGVATSTLDSAGEVTGRWDQSQVTLEDARQAAQALTGSILQIPPMVSAVKIGGRRLHELARAGIEVERPARPVTVQRFDVDPAPDGLPGEGSGPVFSVRIDCSSGTYVRVLAADLGAALGGGAHVRNLRRVAVGPWDEGHAVPLDSLGRQHVLTPAQALPWMDTVAVDAPVAAEVGHGKVLDVDHLGVAGAGPWAVIGTGGELLAVYQSHGAGRVKPVVVLSGDALEGK